MVKIKNKTKSIAITQILILILATFAISWAVGSSIGEVSASAGAAPGALAFQPGSVLTAPSITPVSTSGIVFGPSGEVLVFGAGTTPTTVTTTELASSSVATLGAEGVPFFYTTFGSIVGIAAWTGIAVGLGMLIGPVFGLSSSQSLGLGIALGAGVATTLALNTFTSLGAANFAGTGFFAAFWGGTTIATAGIGLAVAFIVSIFTIKDNYTRRVAYSCYLWDAPTGGENCEKCNEGDSDCSPYQCYSLGQSCEFRVDEVSGQGLCEWNNRFDIEAPVIKARDASLISDDYSYSPDNALSPPNTGVKVDYELSGDSCAPAWTKVSFGVELDERARCKLSPGVLFDSYEEMPDLFLSGGARTYNHSYTLSLPSAEALRQENITIENGGTYNLYIRCQDSNGNSNRGNFGISFCIDDGPDTTVPYIDHTAPVNNAPFASGQTQTDVSLYLNEPAECRWSNLDKSYEAMENELFCSANSLQGNSQNLFKCSGTLDGLKDRQNNDFYFRCQDQPQLKGTPDENQRNTNQQSYKLTLVGTQELAITSVSPNDTTIKDSTQRIPVDIEVETALGYQDGKAICGISDTGEEGSFVTFYYSQASQLYSTNKHTQTLNLPEGDYTYYIRCSDLGGNTDTEIINFSVETDTSPPNVVRVYHDEGQNKLKIITDEEAECVYSNSPEIACSYDFDQDGKTMTSLDDLQHFTNWNSQSNYYIKCRDVYGKDPQSQCSIVVRPFNV